MIVLDHNAHYDRQVATTAKGEQRYHQKYRKQFKNWDMTPMKTRKEYKGTTVAWIFKIDISQNTKFDNLVGFPNLGHKYNLIKMPTTPTPYCQQKYYGRRNQTECTEKQIK